MIPFTKTLKNSLNVFMIDKHILLSHWEFYNFQMLPLNMCLHELFWNLAHVGKSCTLLNWSTSSEHDQAFETRLHH